MEPKMYDAEPNRNPADASLAFQTWKIGDVTVTKVVELVTTLDVQNMFEMATKEEVIAIPWLQPHFATPEGQIYLSIHGLVVDTPTKRIMVDTCIGNDKSRAMAVMDNLQTSFLRDLEAGGFKRESFDVVLCTHLHVDHVGWNTMLENGKWVPTFPNARYLLNRTEVKHWGHGGAGAAEDSEWGEVQRATYDDSVQPIFDAGLVDLVDGAHDVCPEVSLVPTVGHSPGHASVRIRSGGQEALITGDMTHHPSQLVHLNWGLGLDYDPAQATRTRGDVFSQAADRSVLVIGTHWAGATAGRIVRDGQVYRLVV
jgi:glyoxylase-like metal-dependent hydrolase (beta-lactamase superfamily II)